MAERELLDITSLQRTIRLGDLYTRKGKISKIMGLMVEATGLECNMGDICRIQLSEERYALAEVVGILEDTVQLMPYQELDGIGSGSVVINTGRKLEVGITPKMLGRAVDALGSPIDGRDPFPEEEKVWYPINGQPSNPMERPPITEVMELGVRAIDGLLTMGKGQRMGIFAGSGVGKSTLMGMIARNVKADVNVIALVGERGREVVEFIDRDLGPEGMARTVLVVATSDQPAMMRSKCALTATAIAEYFRDQGMDVLLMMDSVTRFGRAQREIGLAAGEPPTRRGFPPSVFSELPKLMERAGNSDKGSITALYTVLVEGDDMTEPIADETRSILDGHIVLSRKLAAANHYPAIDVQASVSRVMNAVVDKEHKAAAQALRKILAKYAEVELLVQIGEYKKGADAEADFALGHIQAVNAFLRQGLEEKSSFEETLAALKKVVL